MPAIDRDLLKRYGLPTALAVALFAAYTGLVTYVVVQQGAKIESLSDEVDHLARLVDLSCQPSKADVRGLDGPGPRP